MHMGFIQMSWKNVKMKTMFYVMQKIEIEREKYWMKKWISLLIKGQIVFIK